MNQTNQQTQTNQQNKPILFNLIPMLMRPNQLHQKTASLLRKADNTIIEMPLLTAQNIVRDTEKGGINEKGNFQIIEDEPIVAVAPAPVVEPTPEPIVEAKEADSLGYFEKKETRGRKSNIIQE